MFFSARDLVEENGRRLEAIAADEEAESTPEQDAMLRSYSTMITCIPLIKILVENGDVEALETLYKNLRKGSDGARGDDAGNLKAAVITWVNDRYGASTPALKANSKDERGLENDHTGRLLCPGEYAWDYDSVRTRIREGDGNFTVTAKSWPIFCYAHCTCDINDVENGLFRGSLLVKAFKFIFTSPSSAAEDNPDGTDSPPPRKRSKKDRTTTRSNVALLIGLRTVTPRSIAYTAVQLRFAFSSATSWRVNDIDFNYAEFYSAIVVYVQASLRSFKRSINSLWSSR